MGAAVRPIWRTVTVQMTPVPDSYDHAGNEEAFCEFACGLMGYLLVNLERNQSEIDLASAEVFLRIEAT